MKKAYRILSFMIVFILTSCFLMSLISCDEMISTPQDQTEQSDLDFCNMSGGTHSVRATSTFALTHVEIPAEYNGVAVTHVLPGAFVKKTMLQSITLPGSIVCIGSTAFAETGLTSINIPEGVTEIDVLAFANCTSLSSVMLPASLTTLGDGVFADCTALTVIHFAGTMQEWTAITERCPNWGMSASIETIVCSDGEITK